MLDFYYIHTSRFIYLLLSYITFQSERFLFNSSIVSAITLSSLLFLFL